MTSSLVGSEMCIRDRPSSCAQCRYWELKQPSSWAQCRYWELSARAAVSYTHLTLPTICSV
eukprot:2127993-Prorocentrum_lima.AAC.1